MSAKTSAQPGRRTPLSLSGTVTKTHPNKGGSNAANGGGNNANGHSASNANKQDNNKNQQSKTEQQPQTINNSENSNKKQQQQAEKKQQQQQNENNKKSNEKHQNGVNNNKQQTQVNESKQQQQQNKEKQQQQQNGNENKSNEKDKKEKAEKTEKLDKKHEKSEKEVKEVKEDKKVEHEKSDSKKEEKKSKEVKENNKDDKKEVAAKVEEKTEKQSSQIKKDEKKSNEDTAVKNVEEKPSEMVEHMEVVEEDQLQQQSPPVTPKSNSKANKTSTPVNKTPTKANEKTPQKSTPSNNSAKTTPVTKRVVTTAVDDEDEEEDNDIEMEPLAIESSPTKSSQRDENAQINTAPCATSTPGKILLSKRNTAAPKTDVQLAMQSGISPERPRVFSQISGRKSIRPISDYTPSKFQMNTQFRESYRRINTELDVTNTSMNVTVGSEVPNNLSFSFFGRGRKRDRTPPQHSQSAIGELQTDMEISPPKRARLDMHGFFSVVSSPLSLLRNRFSKATLQCSTPVKLQQKLNSSEDEIEVQNVSGVSVHEDLAKTEKELSDNTKTNDDNDATVGDEAKETKLKEDIVTPTAVQGESEGKEFTDISLKSEKTCGMEQTCQQQSDIKITETPLQTAVGDPMAKNKRCIIM
ncbi:uncharacterized protein ACRADG_000588 isoform 1-T4 [Cochliomyia hominivorax]